MNDTAPHPIEATSWATLPLGAGGRSLIEASAGTGKTWTISVLYLRLLLEEKLEPRQIVVTTFTDAAAQELRERIRGRIGWAMQKAEAALQPAADAAPVATADAAGEKGDGAAAAESAAPAPDEAWLHERWSALPDAAADAASVQADLNRLRLALAELDLAPIGTLHGLCRRILTDFPFECGTAFDLGEMVDGRGVNDELLDDLWRRLGQSGAAVVGWTATGRPADAPVALSAPSLRSDPADDADFAFGPLERAAWSLGRDSLGKYLEKALQPGILVQLPEAAAAAGVPATPQALGQSLLDWSADAAKFKRADAKLRTAARKLGEFLLEASGEFPLDSVNEVLDNPPDKYLKPDALAKGGHEPVLAAFRAARHWLPLFLARNRERLLQIRDRRLAAAGKLTFDELITRVHAALQVEGSALADRLFETWPVALVDEFQDTDAQQYGILDRIYRDAGGAPRGRLIMIGDPKQAIYRFRGGDIHAYLAARAEATDRLTLGTNHRSSRAFVAALNALYAQAGTVLSSDPDHPIHYEPVQAKGRDQDPYAIDGQPCAQPLAIHYWSEGVPEAAGKRKAAALEACAKQIVELLFGGHTIGGRPLAPGDIAVLLPGNADITELRTLLQARQVPCVTTSKASVFESDWARELQIVLHAALHPRDDGAVRAALATNLGGRTYDELRALATQPDAWQREVAVFQELDRLWQKRGVLAVVRRLVEGASPRLFARADRERALTDLRHLGELLQAQSEQLPGRELLLAWLADQRNGDGAAGEAIDELQLRIESDAARVTLMTVHSSKGLEFGIVLLPLMWANMHNSKDTIAIVHDEDSGQRVIAFGDDAMQRYKQEGQDERFRLLYVALTRARHACHVYALPPARPQKKGGKAAGDPERAPLDTLLERLLRDGQPPAMAHVAWSPGPWSWPQRIWQPAAAPAEPERHARTEPAPVPFESRYSFSALANGARVAAQEETAASDEDAVAEAAAIVADALPDSGPEPLDEAAHAALAWLAPVAGAEFGNAVHAIFERRVIGRPMAAQHDLVRQCLADERVRLRERPLDELVPHLAARVQATLDTPLLPEHDPTLTLGALPPHAQRAEMEFDFVLDEVSLRQLRQVCDFVPGIASHTLRGLMNGKIDLVFEHAGRFHVLDYKTNRLGDGTRLSAYAPARLTRAMDAHDYRFQALLYTVAVDRYLRQRLPHYRRSEHLGEAIYLFVRATGIAPEHAPHAGIWTHRFDESLLDAVDRVLAGRSILLKEAA
ncbi:MAG: UvrD-helicase domain-containing protein [Rhodanobacteraceae bacterium]|jgi:exodeoxyribonuclease V beta subunit|nr:UvrD-helicase domain-containing protein [Rhodanobacteraceae bacterium]